MPPIEEFSAGQDEVRTLLTLCTEAAADDERNNAVRRAAVVLLVSHFESFLRAIAVDFVDALGSGVLESRVLPIGIRELHTIPRMQEILASNDLKQRQSLLKKLDEVSVLWKDTAKPSPGTLSADKLAREVTSANADKIDNLFKLMGNSSRVCDGDIDYVGEDEECLSRNIRLGLTDVVGCRNDIAHGDVSRKPTREDLDRYSRFLAALAARLQRKASTLTSKFVP